MAHFRGIVQGNRGQASRLGTKKSGMQTDCDGWNCGVTVVARHNIETGKDEFFIKATTGSGYGNSGGHIGKVIDGKFIPEP